MRHIEQRLHDARAAVEMKVKKGEASRAHLYDLVTQYEILSDIGPTSEQFQRVKQVAGRQMDSMTSEEQDRIRSADTRREKVRNGFELHAYRFLGIKDKLHTRRVKVAQVHGNGHFEDEEGQSYNIAGVNINKDVPYANTEQLLAEETGLKTGATVTVKTESSESSKHSQSAAVYVGNTNVGRQLIDTGMGNENQDDFSAPAVANRFSNREILLGALWERIAHSDNPINTKFLPVRSGLEQYERTDVYGKKSGSWDSPIQSYVIPTLISLTNKNVFAGAAFGGLFASLFFPHTSRVLPAMGVGALLGAGLSLLGRLYKSGGKPFIPPAVRRRRELDTYYDTLTYIKYRRLAAQAEMQAESEGTNVDDLEGDQFGRSKSGQTMVQSEEVSQAVELALMYRKRYRATLRGSLEGGSSWEAALSALPKTNRAAITDVIIHGSRREKKRLYSLLPEDQQAVLGYKLGIDPRKIPKLEALDEYAEKHAIPDDTYAGWRADISLEYIKVKDVVERKMDPMDFGFYPSSVDAATSGSPEAYVKSPNQKRKRSILEVRQLIRTLLSGAGVKDIDIDIQEQPNHPGQNSHQAEIEFNIKHDRTRHFFHQFKKTNPRNKQNSSEE